MYKPLSKSRLTGQICPVSEKIISNKTGAMKRGRDNGNQSTSRQKGARGDAGVVLSSVGRVAPQNSAKWRDVRGQALDKRVMITKGVQLRLKHKVIMQYCMTYYIHVFSLHIAVLWSYSWLS